MPISLNVTVSPWPVLIIAIAWSLSLLAAFVVGAWVTYRAERKQSPMPGMPRRIIVSGIEPEAVKPPPPQVKL